jgi:hypothetical protein
MGGEDTTTTDTDETIVITTREGRRGPRFGPSGPPGVLVVREPDVDDYEDDDEITELEDQIEETKDYLDHQFETMYYVIAILIILIIVVGYYLYIREGALGM